MDLGEIDRLIHTWQDRVRLATDNVLEITDLLTYKRLAGEGGFSPAALEGVTAARVGPALAAIRELWQGLPLLNDVVNRAVELRKGVNRLFPSGETLKEIDELLAGPSIELPPITNALAGRSLLTPSQTDRRVTPYQLLQSMEQGFELAKVILEVDAAWSRLESGFEKATAEIEALAAQAYGLGSGHERSGGPELDQARQRLAQRRERIERDPLGVADDPTVATDLLVGPVRAPLAAPAAERNRLTDPSIPQMRVAVDVNEHIPSGASRIDAAVVVTPQGFENVAAIRDKLFLLVVDTSASMEESNGAREIAARAQKIQDARRACGRAIDLIPDGQWFAVVTFSTGARTLVPLAQANAANRQVAKQAVAGIQAAGGTEMSAGLGRALDEYQKHPEIDAVLIFMTDGQNNEHDHYALLRELNRCLKLRQEGRVIQSQCCGIGTEWHVDELRAIGTATLGEPPYLVSDPSELDAHFAQALQAAMASTISDVTVNVWTPQAVQLEAFKQTVPWILDLSQGFRLGADGQTRQFATGSWSSEPREFYIAFSMAPQPDAKQICAGRVSVSYKLNGQQVTTAPQNITAAWTGDQSLSARIPMGVARATGQVELAQSIQEGVKAYQQGDMETATSKFGRAVQLAHEVGDEATTSRLRGMVEIVDADSGTVRVKESVDKAVAMDLDAQSTRTSRA